MIIFFKILRLSIAFLRWSALSFALLSLAACQTSGPKKSGPTYSVQQLSSEQKTQYQQALSLMDAQKHAVAEPLLFALTKQKPPVREIWINLILCQLETGEWQKAKANLETVLTRFELSATTLNLAGLVAVEQGEFKKAEDHYQSALKINENYAHALYNIALLYDVYLNDVAKAVSYYQKYLALAPNDQTTRDWTDQLANQLKSE
jgi:tetratricopeptide (TPR) repeat protein